MAQTGWVKDNKYEVYTKAGDRWLIDSPYKKKFDALDRAGELLSSNQFEGVRVIEERKGDDEEYIVFEKFTQLRRNP